MRGLCLNGHAPRPVGSACHPKHPVGSRNGQLNRLAVAGRLRCAASAQADTPKQQQPPPPPVDPFADKTQYRDNALDRFFIRLYTQKMADALGAAAPPLPEQPTYDTFVAVSREIMRGRGAREQRAVVRDVLRSLMPERAPEVFRRLFPPTKWSAEFNALIASSAFAWLVGETELREADVVVGSGAGTGGGSGSGSGGGSSGSGGGSGSSQAAAAAGVAAGADGAPEVRRQRSLVHIKKCRYLEASGCVALCTNMCKVPTQAYFAEEFGLPLTMAPNFEDLSCDMIFGQAAPPLDEDPAFAQPCFAACTTATARRSEPCPKSDA